MSDDVICPYCVCEFDPDHDEGAVYLGITCCPDCDPEDCLEEFSNEEEQTK